MELPKAKIQAAGPVIIENGKVLLVREVKDGKKSPWLFPGGKAEENDLTLEDTCQREVGEELGIKIEVIKKLRTIYITKGEKQLELNHFLAKRIGEPVQGPDIAEFKWHDINDLPEDCEANVVTIINDYKETI